MKIPKLIHQIWIQGADKVPPRYHNWIKSWDRDYPDWHHKIWSGKELEELIRRDYPQYLELYEEQPNMAHKADVGRAILMHKLGGIYVDTDFESFKNAEELFEDYDVILSLAVDIFSLRKVTTDSILISKPGHPYWIQVLNTMKKSIRAPDLIYMYVYSRYYGKDPTIKMLAEKHFLSIRNRILYRIFNTKPNASEGAYGVHHWTTEWGWFKPRFNSDQLLLQSCRLIFLSILLLGMLFVRNRTHLIGFLLILAFCLLVFYYRDDFLILYLFKDDPVF